MGYMGLGSYGASDLAADALSSSVSAMIKSLKASSKETGNEYNTDGPVNICLIVESGIFDWEDYNIYLSDHIDFFKQIAAEMIVKIKDGEERTNEEWESEKNKNEHITAYKRMLKNLNKFIVRLEKEEE